MGCSRYGAGIDGCNVNRKDKVEYCDYIINAVREWGRIKNI